MTGYGASAPSSSHELSRAGARATAVVVDRWPLMRLGIGKALGLADVRAAGEAATLAAGMRMARSRGAGLLVLADATGADVDSLAREDGRGGAPRVIALVRMINRVELKAMVEAGVSAVALRSVGPQELAELVSRVWRGDRVIDPALLPGLAGFSAEAPAVWPPTMLTAEDPLTVALTVKERQVLGQLALRSTNQQIAEALFVAPATVKTHLAHIYAKMGVGNRQDAMSRAVALGIIH